MERLLMEDLVRWKKSSRRKPLLLKGPRQVGKTWLLREFGRRYYEHTIYINFEEQEEYQQFFGTTTDVHHILRNLAMANGKKIVPETTLIIFDEIQECPGALSSLSYFGENAPEYHVVCASSLLGVTLSRGVHFPMGAVNLRELAPMTFTEFLSASGDGSLAADLEQADWLTPVPDTLFGSLSERLKIYFIIGGMPEAVAVWTEKQDVERMQEALSGILGIYERDFGRCPTAKDIPKIRLIWNSLPSQLSRENRKFFYSKVRKGARAREYEGALQWLLDAGFACKVCRCRHPGLPLSSCDDPDAFKIYLPDVGLLRRLSLLMPSAFAEGDRLFTESWGALSENYVLQSLTRQFEITPRYWSVDNPHYEVTFLLQYGNDLIPIEVRTAAGRESKNLRVFCDRYPGRIPLRVRFSMNNLSMTDGFLNIPLFMADHTERLVEEALGRM